MEHRPRNIIVRPFELADVEAVAAMMQELAAFHDDQALATVADISRYASGQHNISTILVASVDGMRCGFSATYDWMNYVHAFPVRNIDLLFVSENMRGYGVGRALLKMIARTARLAACQRLTVGTEPDNQGANAFYQRMGFDLRRPAANRYAVAGIALEQLASA